VKCPGELANDLYVMTRLRVMPSAGRTQDEGMPGDPGALGAIESNCYLHD